MERIKDDLYSANLNTKKALQDVEKAKDKIIGTFQVVNNIYTEGGHINIERLGQAMDSKIEEVELLKSIIKHLENILEVKDSQIKLMLDTLTDNSIEISRLKKELSKLTS